MEIFATLIAGLLMLLTYLGELIAGGVTALIDRMRGRQHVSRRNRRVTQPRS